ncbi:OLC1v1010592C1 [Oldenlandia corymbosa var. corymbosa]|nr:OLC1v1010592C1 [Oldenlandia corymbosa var. corymbosa]
MAIFTAECSHSFHFPCVAGHVRNQEAIRCPVCNSPWTEMPLLSIHNVSTGHPQNQMPKLAKEEGKKMEFPSSPRTPTSLNQHTGSGNGKPSSVVLKVYNDDEPLMSPTCGARFNPIPESDECDEDIIEEFQGFQTTSSPLFQKTASTSSSNVESRILPESAVLSVSRNHQTLVVVLKIKAPPAPLVAARRAPIDLVTVIDVSGKMTNEKLQMVRRSLRLVVSSMSAADRLSIVAFSSTSKRLLPLRRMTTAGRRSARRIVDAIVALDGTAPACANDALKKAVKVLEDRREKNPVASIILLSDSLDFHRSHNQRRQTSTVYTTRITHLEVPAVAVGFNPSSSALDQTHPVDDGLPKCIGSLLCVMVQDLRVNLGFIPGGSNQAEILGVYSYAGRAAALGSGVIRLGELFAEEERELLVELKVPSVSSLGPHHVLSVRCSYKDPSTQELIQGKEQPLLVPRPRAVRSTTPTIERLRSLFVATRAVAESRRLVEKSDLAGAYQMLSSARNMVLQAGSGDEVVRGLEAELAELHWRRQQQNQVRRRQNVERRPAANLDEKSSEPLTPTSAWRAAERLAKVAIMRKSMNRVSDLHGFENARF